MINSKYKDIKAVLFDCDGMICKLYDFARVLDQDHAITIAMTKNFFVNIFPDCAVNKKNIVDELPSYLEKWGWNGDVYAFVRLWLESERNTEANVIEIVKKIKSLGLKTGLATNQEIHRARYMREVMKLTNIFDDLYISSEIEAMKPQKEYFERTTGKLGLKPSEILFIDDQQNYLNAASASGWQTYQFTSVEDLEEELFT